MAPGTLGPLCHTPGQTGFEDSPYAEPGVLRGVAHKTKTEKRKGTIPSSFHSIQDMGINYLLFTTYIPSHSAFFIIILSTDLPAQ